MRGPAPSLKTIPPAAARLCLEVEKFLLSELDLCPGQGIVLALSGGADSTALALIFHILRSRLNLKLSAFHLDHALRQESARDALFVDSLCQWLKIPCRIERIDITACAQKKRIGLEEAGRLERLRLLEVQRLANGADKIATGHQREDLCEDILMRLARGAGWPALGGMKAKTGRIIRPLLFIEPERLKSLLLGLDLEWREDASNDCLDFKRNRLRKLIMPLLRRENPAIGRGMASLRKLAEIDDNYWNEAVEASLKARPWQIENGPAGEIRSIGLPAPLLANAPRALRLRLYRKALNLLAASGAQARAETLLKLDQALAEGAGGKIFQFPGGLRALLRARSIHFYGKEADTS